MPLPLKIALRYIFAKRYFNFITVITLISILGIMVGVAALICVTSIFAGFQKITEQQILGFDPHIRVVPAAGVRLTNADTLAHLIEKMPGVAECYPAIEARVVAMSGANILIFTLQASGSNGGSFSEGIKKSIVYGRFLLGKWGALPCIVLGVAIADRLHVLPGDTISIITAGRIEASIKSYSVPIGEKAFVSGIFQTNVKDYDMNYAFSDIAFCRKLVRMPEAAAGSVDIRMNSTGAAMALKKDLEKTLPPNLKILTWQDLNKELYRVMAFEQMASFTVLSLIILIAVFNVLASLTMTVVEKRADIAVLKAMGAGDRSIRSIFIMEGIIIGTIGTILGCLLGLGLCVCQQNYKWFKIDTTKFIIDAIPVLIDPSVVAAVCIVALILSFLATIYPARRAWRSEIAVWLRTE